MAIKKLGDKWVLDFRVAGKNSERLRKKFDKKIDAQVWLDKFKEKQKAYSGHEFTETNPEAVTFEREAKYWTDNVRFKLSESHMKRVDGILEVLLKKHGKLTLDQLNPEVLIKIQQEIIGSGRARATANRYTEVVSAIVNHSIEHRRFPFNPLSGFKKLTTGNNEMEYWRMDEVQSFLCFADEKYPRGHKLRWVYLVYYLAVNTGLRAGEVWGVKLSDFSRELKSFNIRRQYDRVAKDFEMLKSTKNSNSANITRRVPCNQLLINELDFHVEQYGIKRDDLIFSKDGKAICHDIFAESYFRKDVDLWGGRKIRFHDMRHTAATLMVGAGIDVVTVQGIMGHKNVETTMKYVHLLSANVSRVADSFFISPVEVEKKPRLKLVGE
jgi:integrase